MFTYNNDFDKMKREAQKAQDKQSSKPDSFLDVAQSTFIRSWTTMQVALAYQSKDQDVIYNNIKESISEEEVDWVFMKKLSIPIWLKDISKLKHYIEIVAKTEYRRAGQQVGVKSRAAVTALWYILIQKKQLLCTLYKTEKDNVKVYDMLMNNFEEP